ncbi:ExbD/TolR family protein [Methylocaldum szegediense]|mgnify:CR=1 FL=1|uniref:Biopolymer transport protein exbD1 n=1 Tax=Methylocaldum szegediense TaxID=73780 RepID=A0ABM9I0R6_9GAMM|nr:biopolymer transporter ExbD [Methylocaldum szegediense]CAI8813290.1 Biopolymer transport protein exbD1 [Methylocaldum szegediense]
MAFGSFNQGQGGVRPSAEINMIPLIDIMLVLLVIFMITTPLLTHQVKIDLPKAASQPSADRAEHIDLSIDAAGQIFWNNEAIDRAGMRDRFAAAAQQQPQPEVHLRADKTTAYQIIAEVLAASANAGVTRIGFISDPNETEH